MSGIDLAALYEKAKELDQLRKDQEDVILEINKFHKKLQSTPPEMFEKSWDAVLNKLRTLYGHAKELAESEVSASTSLMTQLDSLLQSGHSAAQRKKTDIGEQKKKRMKQDADIIRFLPTASVRSQLEFAASLKGEQVAARVRPDDNENDEWIVMKVIHFDKDAKEFEVVDEEPNEEGETGKTYKLPMSHVIPFPKKGDPSNAPDFPLGRHVLAVYPGTTALYKATVVNPHRKRKSDDYFLEFDDDEEDGSLPQRNVPFHKVVPLPEGHRQ